MFEKEAEEYANNWRLNKNNDLNFAELVELRAVIYKANKDGAEFGFQKGIKARINTTTISDCPIKDEWHYPSKGEYPKEYKDILICFLTEDDMKDCVRGWYEYDLDEDEHYFKTVNIFGTAVIKNVYAWKEIVLPKEIE